MAVIASAQISILDLDDAAQLRLTPSTLFLKCDHEGNLIDYQPLNVKIELLVGGIVQTYIPDFRIDGSHQLAIPGTYGYPGIGKVYLTTSIDLAANEITATIMEINENVVGEEDSFSIQFSAQNEATMRDPATAVLTFVRVKEGKPVDETVLEDIQGTLTQHGNTLLDQANEIISTSGRISSIESTIPVITADISALESASATLDSSLSALDDDVSDLVPRMAAAESGITAIDGEVESLSTRVTNAEGAITLNGTSITQNADDLSALAVRVTSAEGTVSTHSTQITQNADSISTVASRVTTVEGTTSSHSTLLTQTASDISSLATRVTDTEDDISSQSTLIAQNASQITSIASQLSALDSVGEGWEQFSTTVNQNATDITSLASRVTTVEGTVTSQGTSITQNATSITSIATDVSNLGDTVTGLSTSVTQNASSISSIATDVSDLDGTVTGLSTSVTQNASSISSIATDLSALDGTVTNLSTSVTQNATGITSLATRVSDTEGDITTMGTSISQNASDIQTIATDVSAIDGIVTSQATSITQNASSISSLVTSMQAIEGEEGILAQHTSQIAQNADSISLKVEAVDTLGGSISGAKLEVGTTDGASYIMLDADKVLIDGSIKAQKIDTESLTSDEGFIDNLGATTLTLQNNGVIKSSSYSAGGEGFAIKANGEVEFGSGTFRGNIISTDASFYSGSIKNGQLETSSSSGTAYKFNESTIMNTQFNSIMSAPVGFLDAGSTVTSLQASGSRTLLNPARNFYGNSSELRPALHMKADNSVAVYNPGGMSPYVFYSTNGVNWYPAAEEIFVEPYTNCFIGNDYHSGYSPSKGLFWFYRRTQRVRGDNVWYYHKIYRSTNGINWSYTGIPSDWSDQRHDATLHYLDTVNKWILINIDNSADRRVYLSSDISNVANWVRYNNKIPNYDTRSKNGYHYNEITKEIWVRSGDSSITTSYATQDGLNWYELSIPSDIKYFANMRTVNFPDKGFGFIWGSFGGIYKVQNGTYTAINLPFSSPSHMKDIVWDSQFNRFVLLGYEYNTTDGHRAVIAFTTDFVNYEYRLYTFTNSLGQTVYNPTTRLFSSLSSQWTTDTDAGQYMASFTLSKQTTTVTKISKTNVTANYLDLSFNDDGNLTFPVSNENKVFSFSANAEIPERLLIKKDMNFENGLNVNLDKKAKIYGAVFN